MSKQMGLEELSSIKGAKSSEVIEELFKVIKEASDDLQLGDEVKEEAVQVEMLRQDEVIDSSEKEKKGIKSNFPEEKNGYLVVSKVIEE